LKHPIDQEHHKGNDKHYKAKLVVKEKKNDQTCAINDEAEDKIKHRIKEPAFEGVDIIDEIGNILCLEFPVKTSGRFIHDGLKGFFSDHERRIPHKADS
jgi:hypothetical protein